MLLTRKEAPCCYRVMLLGKRQSHCAGGGETVEDVAQRLQVLLSRLESSHKDRHILLVSHGDTLSIFAAVALGVDLKSNRRYGLDTGQLLHLSKASQVPVSA